MHSNKKRMPEMILRLITFIIAFVLFAGFLWFFLQVLYLGTTEFFRRRNCNETTKQKKQQRK
jgi:uncharacterized protein HemY